MASDILLDTSIRRHPRLIVEISPQDETEVRQLLEALAQENVSAQTIVLDALRIASEQTYFWAPEWQTKERAAEEALAAGRARTFNTVDEMLEFLDEE